MSLIEDLVYITGEPQTMVGWVCLEIFLFFTMTCLLVWLQYMFYLLIQWARRVS